MSARTRQYRHPTCARDHHGPALSAAPSPPYNDGLTAVPVPVPVSVLSLFRNVFNRHHVFVVRSIEHDHALRRTARDADVLDWTTDELPLVGHQHDLVAVFHRERGYQLAV